MHVFDIPSSAPFLRTLIAALLDGRLVPGFAPRDNPESLADATLYLPTRRAGRLAHDIFLDLMGRDAVILPRIMALGEPDEEELAFADAAAPDTRELLNLAPAIGNLSRRLWLAQLIGQWAKSPEVRDLQNVTTVIGGPGSTLALADDLARLMDDMATRGVDWRALDTLVPDDLDDYWKLTLRFLRVATELWPPILAERGLMEPAARRDLLIEAEAKRLAGYPDRPVIAAGSTGSMPSTAKLLHAIAKLPKGAVVLPGLDRHLDEAAWRSIGGPDDAHPSSNHPQYALHNLLHTFGIERRDVVPLGEETPHGREVLSSEAMRPSSATAEWHTRLHEPNVAQRIAAGMTKLAVIAADNSEMEALAIAVAMRESHENAQVCALVTPDRALARRVIAALGRWDLPFDDSGGDALTDTPAGLFARLVCDVAAEALAPVPLLALLKHPAFRLGRAEGGWRTAIVVLEEKLFRGTRPDEGCGALAAAFEALRADDKTGALDDAAALVAALCEALAPLTSGALSRPQDFVAIAALHRAAIIALATDHEDFVAAFDGAAGAALAQAFEDVAAEDASGLQMTLGEYAEVFETAFGDRPVRRPQIGNPLLRIYGLLEARLTQSDRVILGGLVEGVWPPAPRTDPWLSRPMRHQLGLDLPERRIGLTAHDFAQMLGAEDVILSHAAKSSGAPAVASRFLHRLEAVAKDHWPRALEAGRRYVDYAQALDRPDEVRPCPQPMPSPPRDARPLRLSVTQIEDWFRDPYTVYAKHILKLRPLDPVDMPPSVAERGSAIHEALADFTMAYPDKLPDDPVDALRGFGRARFASMMQRPEVRALWWPRFLRVAEWFAEWEAEKRVEIKQIVAEQPGEMRFALDGGRVFTLTTRADRIERRRDGTYGIVDYKTGQPPSSAQVAAGLSPQLTLMAAILNDGGFPGIAKGASVSSLAYVRLSGNQPAGRHCEITFKPGKGEPEKFPDEAAAEIRAHLHAFIRRFDNGTEPYRSLLLPMWTKRYGDYDPLARIDEWSIAVGSDE